MTITPALVANAIGAGLGMATIWFPVTYFAMRNKFSLKELRRAWWPYLSCVFLFAIFRLLGLEPALDTPLGLTASLLVPVATCAAVLYLTYRKNESDTGHVGEQSRKSRFFAALDRPFKRAAALIAVVGLSLLAIGWVQIVMRYWQPSSCIRTIIDHLMFNDFSYVSFTCGFYLTLIGLLWSVFYNKGIGRVVNWVKTGTAQQTAPTDRAENRRSG